MNISMLCRSCMKDLSHNDPELVDEVAMEMFLFCINQQFQEADAELLPKHFCSDCNFKITLSYKFIKLAKETNETLRNLILQSGEIKNESKDDDDNKYLGTDDSNIMNDVKTNYLLNTDSLLDNTEDLQEIYNDDHYDNDESEDNYICKNKLDKIENKANKRNYFHQGVKKNIDFNNDTPERELKIVVPEITTENYCQENTGKGTSNTNNELSCKVCKKTYTKLTLLKRHYKIKHNNKSKSKINPEEIQKLKAKDNDVNKNNLKQCPVCDKTYKLQNCLNKHMVREHSTDLNSMKQYICPYCPIIFTSSHSLRHHKYKTHAEDGRFGCNACDKRFRKRKQLAVHALTHSAERPFICDTCHMSFKMKQVLIKHLAIHENDRPYLCDICAMGFKRADTLKDHVLIHARARSYACGACGFTCTSRTTRARHALKHAGTRPHVCVHCAKTFYEKGSLDRHIRIHTGEKPYKCPSCPLVFVDHWKRKMHIMRVHQVPFEEIPRLTADGQPLNKW